MRPRLPEQGGLRSEDGRLNLNEQFYSETEIKIAVRGWPKWLTRVFRSDGKDHLVHKVSPKSTDPVHL